MSESPAPLSPAKQRLLQRLLEEGEARSADVQWGVADAYVAPLRTGGSKPPLFLIHPIMGVAFPYHALVAALDPDRAAFGLQSFDNQGSAHPSWKMERIVESYVAEVRKIQPKGPYHLAGWSFGSMAAYEMACQLAEAGEEVRSLIMLDTWAPGSGSALDYLRFGWSVCLDIWPFVGQYLRLRRAAANAGRKRGTVRAPDIFPLLSAYHRNSLAVMLYRPRRKFAGKLHLLRSIKSPGVVLPEPDWGWKRFALGGVVVRTLVGNHMDLLIPPQVDLVAAEMNRFLSE
jgi:thioesterase domain-containing protein